MDDTRWYQDEAGTWWFPLKNGNRYRGELRTCETCGTEFPYRNVGRSKHGRFCSRICANQATRPGRNKHGAEHGNWKGGRHVRKRDGYVQIHVEIDGIRKWALEHRHVMSQHLGRPLYDYETVHHKNGDRADNRIDNLELRVGRHGRGATEAHCPTCTCFH